MAGYSIQACEFENYLSAVADCKKVVDDVTCWSLRKLCSIFELNFQEITRVLQDTVKRLVSIGNKSGYSLGYYEFDGLKARRAKSFVRELTLKAEIDGFITDVEDYLINSYIFYIMADCFVYDKDYVGRLKDYIVLESAQGLD